MKENLYGLASIWVSFHLVLIPPLVERHKESKLAKYLSVCIQQNISYSIHTHMSCDQKMPLLNLFLYMPNLAAISCLKPVPL
jgi:hypothetical protein